MEANKRFVDRTAEWQEQLSGNSDIVASSSIACLLFAITASSSKATNQSFTTRLSFVMIKVRHGASSMIARRSDSAATL